MIALVLGVVLFSAGVFRLLSGSAAEQPPTALQAAPRVSKSVYLPVRVLGGNVALSRPQEAIRLPNGNIVAVDTGHKRVVLLDPGGRLIRSLQPGPSTFLEPYAVAASHSLIYALDSSRPAVYAFDFHGNFKSQTLAGTSMSHPRGMAVAPNGELYLADPGDDTVIATTWRGVVTQRLKATTGARISAFNQPSDVAVGSDGLVYVLDNVNQRILALTPRGGIVHQWNAPGSSTSDSAHVLPLPGGKLLVSDPAGSLLLYSRGSASATRYLLRLPGSALAERPTSPLGIASFSTGGILITDNTDGKLLVASLR